MVAEALLRTQRLPRNSDGRPTFGPNMTRQRRRVPRYAASVGDNSRARAVHIRDRTAHVIHMDKPQAHSRSSPTHRPTLKRETAWQARFSALEKLTQELGRLPRSDQESDPDLLAWISNQRRSLTMAESHREQLESLPDWDWEPRASAWEYRAEQLRTFIAANKRAPRVRSSDAAERALAHWHSRQRVAYDAGTLTPARALAFEYVTRLLPE